MKKGTSILLLFLFLFTNSGMALSIHWCGGKISSVKFLGNNAHGCRCGKKAMKEGCCKDKTVTLKANAELAKVSSLAFKCSVMKVEFEKIRISELKLFAQSLISSSDNYHPPLFKPREPIYLSDRVLRI